MNTNNNEQWLRTKLIPNLPPNSVVVVDNASYYNKQLDVAPTSNTKKPKKNETWNLAWITDLVNEKVNLLGATKWGKLCSKIKRKRETFVIHVGDDDSGSDDDESSSDDGDDDETATSSTNTASSSGFHVTHDDLMEGVSTIPFFFVIRLNILD
ncbi:hypothetical protein ABMA28_003132 [Loxostege sticticalis]|uniref:Uncharacterized protein n=1 Tax=Loxostege sticticalis TaxID=481309 RepID=A0ABD0SV43_LOXSC